MTTTRSEARSAGKKLGLATALRTALATTLLGGALACTPEEVARTQHEESDPVVYAPSGETASRQNLLEIAARLRPESARLLAATAAPALASLSAADRRARIQELQALVRDVGLRFVLNANYIKNRLYSTSPEMKSLLTRFNEALWTLHALDRDAFLALPGAPAPEPSLGPAGPARPPEPLLDTYVRSARDGCDAELRGCNEAAFRFFNSDSRTQKIIEIKAAQIDREIEAIPSGPSSVPAATPEDPARRLRAVARYYSVLRLAAVYGTRIADREWQLAYMKRARDYALYLDSLPASARNRDLLAQHGRAFDRMVQEFEPAPGNPDFLSFVEAFSPWTRSRLEADPFPFGTDRMFSFASQFLLYAHPGANGGDGAGGESCGLSPSLRAAIQSSQAADDQYGPSFSAQARALRLDPDPAKRQPGDADLLRGLKVTEIESLERPCFFDEYFYMVDRLYRGHLNVEEANRIWEGSKRDEARLLATANF